MPTILAVDDSAVMQGLVKQALGKDFRVLVTDNAVDALPMIYHEQIAVLLLFTNGGKLAVGHRKGTKKERSFIGQ